MPRRSSLFLNRLGRGLVVEAGDDHGPDVDAPLAEVVDQLQRVGVVGDAEIRPDLLALDVAGVDAEDDVGLVLELLQQPHLDVGIVARAGRGPRGSRRAACRRIPGRACCRTARPARGSRPSAPRRYFSLSNPGFGAIAASFVIAYPMPAHTACEIRTLPCSVALIAEPAQKTLSRRAEYAAAFPFPQSLSKQRGGSCWKSYRDDPAASARVGRQENEGLPSPAAFAHSCSSAC